MDRLARSVVYLNQIVGELVAKGVVVEFLHEHVTHDFYARPRDGTSPYVVHAARGATRNRISRRSGNLAYLVRPRGGAFVRVAGCPEGCVVGRLIRTVPGARPADVTKSIPRYSTSNLEHVAE